MELVLKLKTGRNARIYRGKRRSVQFRPPVDRVFVRVGRMGHGLSRQVVSATQAGELADHLFHMFFIMFPRVFA